MAPQQTGQGPSKAFFFRSPKTMAQRRSISELDNDVDELVYKKRCEILEERMNAQLRAREERFSAQRAALDLVKKTIADQANEVRCVSPWCSPRGQEIWRGFCFLGGYLSVI